MRKKIKKLVIIVLLLLIIFGLTVIYLGYKQYENFIDEVSITEKVKIIRNNENYTSISDINPLLIKATYITEDRRFYERNSVLDYQSLGRALWTNITSLSLLEGGSTIPQQLSKNLYLTYNTSLVDKVSEYFITQDIINMYSKDEILELYVNIIYYGDGYYGVYEASEGYFDIKPMDLNDNEATLLAGLPQSPAYYELSSNYESAKIRQQHVLNKLIENDIITMAQAKSILEEPIRGDYQ